MAISSVTRVEFRTDPSLPTAAVTKAEIEATQPTDSSKKSCPSKSCVHKLERTTPKDQKKSKDSGHSDSDESESDSSSSSEEAEDSSSSSESESESRNSRKKSASRSKKTSTKSKKKNKPRKTKKGKKVAKDAKPKYNEEDEPSEKGEKEDEVEKVKVVATDIPGVDSIETIKTHLIAKGFDMSKKHNNASLKLFLRTLTKKSDDLEGEASSSEASESEKKTKKSRKGSKAKRASKVEFKRIDEIWDEELYDYKLKETSEHKKTDEFEEYIFTVRRKFDNEGHYEETVVDIKSQLLKECLQTVLADVEGISLVEDTPRLMPNMLFLFLEELRGYITALRTERRSAEKKKTRKAAGMKTKHLKVLIEYLDKDFDETKKSLYPLLETGRITFEFLWALYKPNTLAYTSTYGDDEQPRAFKIESIYKHRSFSRGTYYELEGKYLDFDGKCFGTAEYSAQVNAFQGTRKITSLACYPLKYHSDVGNLEPRLIERGKMFLSLAGQIYKNCKGMAYIKKDSKVLKANVNGRVMLDPGTFRRINPNYPLQDVEARVIELDEDKECCCETSDTKSAKKAKKQKGSGRLFRLVKSAEGDATVIEVDLSEHAALEDHVDSAEKEQNLQNTFSEEELLIASPVLPGFSFSEKAWLEFNVATISNVQWNDGAFDSLVLPEQHKSIVKALVSAHGLHASKSFDDIIAGKGKGLVAVLHGRPGLGKTLTCEAVSDLLKRPLYTVSAGDLGTNPSQLEAELQSILDIAHTWNAVLLLDEADVFLEERSVHDIHRNALVSIFLRLLEYFQGILFLTTNRVGTFDEAFVSRIHLSLRYNELTIEAKRSVWKTFIDKVQIMEGSNVQTITEKDLGLLARYDMNGRQIKNLVKTAQALALHEANPLGMEHIRRVIDVARSFEMDLKGGSGYSDAMRSYT